MQVKKEKEIFLKTRHLHGRIAKSMPHTQPKQNVQSAKQKNKKKNAKLELSQVLTQENENSSCWMEHNVKWSLTQKNKNQRLNGKKKGLEHSHQNQKFIATKSMMVTTCANLVVRTMTRTTKTKKQ